MTITIKLFWRAKAKVAQKTQFDRKQQKMTIIKSVVDSLRNTTGLLKNNFPDVVVPTGT